MASAIEGEYCDKEDYLKFIFNYFNTDQTGSNSLEELQDQVAKLGLEMPKRLGREIMREADHDEDGAISYQEFLENMQERISSSSSEEDSEETQ